VNSKQKPANYGKKYRVSADYRPEINKSSLYTHTQQKSTTQSTERELKDFAQGLTTIRMAIITLIANVLVCMS